MKNGSGGNQQPLLSRLDRLRQAEERIAERRQQIARPGVTQDPAWTALDKDDLYLVEEA